MQEGDSITVLCIALGTPTPTVTLYVAGHPIRSTTSRHMVTTLHNVTRLMSEDHSWIKFFGSSNSKFGVKVKI